MTITGFCTGQSVLDDRKMDCMRCWERGREGDEGLALGHAGSLLHSMFGGREAVMWSSSSVP